LRKQIEDKYKELAVKINSNGITGSGCLFQPNTKEYSYILTAKHCITNDENFDKNQVSIKRFKADADEKDLKVLDIFLHEKLDVAIIKIEYIPDLNVRFSNHDKSQDVSIYGYPNKLTGAAETRQNINCTISFRHKMYSELSAENIQFTYETSVPENIKGLSGAGVYIERENELILIGVFTRLKGADGIYNTYHAFNLTPFVEIIDTNNLNFLSKNNFEEIKKDGELVNKVFFLPYKLSSEPYYLNRQIDDFFVTALNFPKNIWFSGISGIGKTTLVFRNLKQLEITPLFFELSSITSLTISDYFEYINEELIEQTNLKTPSSKVNVFEKISDNLSNISDPNNIILFVDEVPISDLKIFEEFISGFITITDMFYNRPSESNKIKWIISTRINPEIHLKNDEDCLQNNQKARKNFSFKKLEIWSDEELRSLLDILKFAINFELNTNTEKQMISEAKGRPNVIKNIIERLIIENCSIEEAIKIVKSESV
jgi:hypothetical protein